MKATKVISTRIVNSKRLVKFLGIGRSDVQEKNEVGPFGIDSNPVKDMVAIMAPTSEIGKDVIIGYINTNQMAEVGETRLFSTDLDGVEQIFIHLKNDGNIEFGDNADNLVRFSKLKLEFDNLKNDFNSLVTAYNSHVHITTATVGATAVPGIISPTTSTGTPSTADISPSKIDELKCS